MSKKKLKYLKSFKHDDQDRLNSLYDDIKYLSLDLTDNKIENKLWISNNWDAKRGKRGTYKVNINLSISEMTNDLVDVLDRLPNSKDSIKTAEWFRKYRSIPNLGKYKRNILFDFIDSLNDYVSYNNGEISILVRLVDGDWDSDNDFFYVVICMDFGIESTTRLSLN